MLMSITGMLGSGKSTVCCIINKKFGFEVYSTGTINREYARTLGIDVNELGERLKTDHSLDNQIDSTVTRISKERKNDKLIFDSRMAWHFAENTFKIFLTIDPMEAAIRVMKNQRGEEERYSSVEEAKEKLIARSVCERERFMQIYGVDYYDYNNFNIIIDTTSRSPEEIVSLIMENYESYCNDPAAFVSPKIM